MKCLTCLIVLSILSSCTKDKVNLNGESLVRVTLNGKLQESYSYLSSGLLDYYKYYGSCTQNPMDEELYIYEGGHLKTIQTISRSHYSATTAQCDPTGGDVFHHAFNYDGTGKILTVVRSMSTATFIYNQQGFIEKQVLVYGSMQTETLYEYDSRGNMIKETSPGGNIIYYEYDDKPNPHYLGKHRPHLLTAFNISPNNVVKGTGTTVFTRQLTYKANGLPATITDSNGATYTYEYE